MDLNDSISVWESFWDRSTSAEPYIEREERMAQKWNQRSATFGQGRDKGDGEKRTADIVSFLEQNGVTIKGARVLDIGCGNGALALPLARLGADVTAFDIASGMLDQLEQRAVAEGLKVRSVAGSWWSADIDLLGFRGAFDLVMAARTPAIRNGDCLERMMACSRDSCFHIGFISKNMNSIHGEVSRTILKRNHSFNPPSTYHPFMYLYLNGYRPEIRINYRESTEELPWQQAAEKTIAFLSGEGELTSQNRAQVLDYFRTSAVDGICTAKREMSEGHMLWRVG